jgi:hypothetical protein
MLEEKKPSQIHTNPESSPQPLTNCVKQIKQRQKGILKKW